MIPLQQRKIGKLRDNDVHKKDHRRKTVLPVQHGGKGSWKRKKLDYYANIKKCFQLDGNHSKDMHR